MSQPPPIPLAYQTPGIVDPLLPLRQKSVRYGWQILFWVLLIGAASILAIPPRPTAAGIPATGGSAERFLSALPDLAFVAAVLWWCAGSIRVRRWVRPFALIFGMLVFAFGILFFCADFWLMFQFSNAIGDLPMLLGVAIMFVICVGIPAQIAWFYKNPATRAMLERYDPEPRWTDDMPLRVLSICVAWGALAIVTISIFPSRFTTRSKLEHFGYLRTLRP